MRKKYVLIALLAALALLIFGSYMLSRSRTFQLFGEIIPRVNTSQKIIALTFDDGPTPEVIDEILGSLRERNTKATFFVTGAELESNPELGRRVVSEGHELGNHSYSHKTMVLKTPSFIREEIERTDQLIRSSGYQGPIHFRPPYSKKLLLLPWYLSKTNRKTIMCDIEPDSYEEVAADADRIVEHVLARARPGSIILLHVWYKSRATSLKAVPAIIDGLRQKGYEFKTVSELISSANRD